MAAEGRKVICRMIRRADVQLFLINNSYYGQEFINSSRYLRAGTEVSLESPGSQWI